MFCPAPCPGARRVLAGYVAAWHGLDNPPAWRIVSCPAPMVPTAARRANRLDAATER